MRIVSTILGQRFTIIGWTGRSITNLRPDVCMYPASRWMGRVFRDTPWFNEAVSRNHALCNSQYSDDDIVILSDIDEIIDSHFADIIIENTKKYGIITVNVYFTMFYFNLFCPQWAGPANFSYRIFSVKGNILRKRFYNDSDYLRKSGERSKLLSGVKCLDGFMGYHHSWLGDENFIINKLKSYAHEAGDHSPAIMTNGEFDIEKIKQHLLAGRTIFPDTSLKRDNTIRLLPSIEAPRASNSGYFI